MTESKIERTTIMASKTLIKRVADHVDKRGEYLVDFYTRAIINQLESEGDWGIRDEVEEDTNVSCEKQA